MNEPVEDTTPTPHGLERIRSSRTFLHEVQDTNGVVCIDDLCDADINPHRHVSSEVRFKL